MPPKPARERMEFASRDFLHGVQTFLKGKSMATIYINMELDVWHYITMNKGTPSEHIGYKMYEKQDFQRFDSLPPDWYYWLDQHGERKSIDFPMKAKPTVSWTTSKYIMNNGKLVKAPKLPVEKISLTIVKRACDINSV